MLPNYIDVYIANSQLHIDINTADGSYNENIENIIAGEYTISIDWSSGVEILINGAYHSYTEVGSISTDFLMTTTVSMILMYTVSMIATLCLQPH